MYVSKIIKLKLIQQERLTSVNLGNTQGVRISQLALCIPRYIRGYQSTADISHTFILEILGSHAVTVL